MSNHNKFGEAVEFGWSILYGIALTDERPGKRVGTTHTSIQLFMSSSILLSCVFQRTHPKLFTDDVSNFSQPRRSRCHWVLWLADEIQKIGIFSYVFEQDPQPGRYVSEKIQEAITASDAVVVFLTGNSHHAPYVQQEIGFAEGLRKLIIPLVQPGLDRRMFAMLQGRE